jgi:dTDP-4-dehydrorhamnose 3,5-epimerase
MKEPSLIYLKKYSDNRGHFIEKFNKNIYRSITDPESETVLQNCPQWVQENFSFSKKHVLRGIHYQYNNPQAKLVHCLHGEILDIIVDLRSSSSSFGKHFKFNLNDEVMLYVPKGFGHSFLALSNDTIVEYKCSDYYSPNDQYTIKWDDKTLNINWGVESPIMSDKDSNGISFNDAPKFA